MKEMFLYGLGGAADKYRIIRYEAVDSIEFSVGSTIRLALWMKNNHPSIEHIYLVDNRGGLGYEVMRTMKRNTIEGNVAFKDLCERSGLLII